MAGSFSPSRDQHLLATGHIVVSGQRHPVEVVILRDRSVLEKIWDPSTDLLLSDGHPHQGKQYTFTHANMNPKPGVVGRVCQIKQSMRDNRLRNVISTICNRCFPRDKKQSLAVGSPAA